MTPNCPSFFEHHQLALVGESPTGIRSGLLLDGIDSLLRHCGLVPGRYRLLRRGEAACEAGMIEGLQETLKAVGVEGEVHPLDGGPTRLEPAALTAALADPEVVELRVGGAGWALSLPLRPGTLMAVSTRPDLPAERLPDLLSGLLEACQADWAVADTPAALATRLASQAQPPDRAEISPPPLGAFNWRCADWLAEVECQQANLPVGVTCARAFSGASVIQVEPPTPTALAALGAALPNLERPWLRPPLLRWQADGREPQAIRPASPALAARQRFLAGQVSARFGLTPDQRSLHGALASHWAGITPTPIQDEALSAFVGEAAVCCGGRWHRVLDPTIAFPLTLLVIVGETSSFNPHAALQRWRHGGINPFAALEAFLASVPGGPPPP
ncbi:hypothetical protein [Zoogloea sp.]|uniref:hypothetical protein n=1 Tax=Zoogloea sp. TaxID=49181 RepID=UPI0035B074C4